MKETNKNMICRDLKLTEILQAMQLVYTKFCCSYINGIAPLGLFTIREKYDQQEANAMEFKCLTQSPADQSKIILTPSLGNVRERVTKERKLAKIFEEKCVHVTVVTESK